MTVVINGTTGITNVNGSASAPAETGSDTDSGIFYGTNTVSLATNGTTALTVDSSQNVGIGTASPSYKLDILTGGGGVYAAQFGNGTAAQGIRIVTGMDSTSSGITTAGGTRLIQFDGTNNITQFYTNASERMRIDSSGRLLVGTTSAPGQTGGVVVANNELFVYNIPTTASGANCNISSGEGNRFYRSTSALKYKQDIRDLETIDIGKFRPVRYKSKCENDDQTKDHFGFIADEAAAAGFEELVLRGVDGEVEGFQYDRMTVVLTAAIQKQQALITALTERITALEAK